MNIFSEWSFEPGIVIPLALAAFLYIRGARPERGVRRFEAISFASGWLSLELALVSPLHELGEQLVSAHMAQHVILMSISAPLLVLGRPLVFFIWALPQSWRRTAGAIGKFIEPGWKILSSRMTAW